MASMSAQAQQALTFLGSFLANGASHEFGTIPIPSSGSSIFYSSPKSTGVLKFPDPQNSDVEALIRACDLATFGVESRSVFDETYRKAWKLDTEYFATQFVLPPTFCSELSSLLLGASKSEFGLRFELYKLNVYGPGSFFKPHVDTPRSSEMIGSLVIILPTNHTGGELILRDGEDVESILDSSSLVSLNPASPLAAYAAFYSDVEHEVRPVLSGYRITLTYNLYRTPKVEPMSSSVPTPPGRVATKNLQSDIEVLLNDTTFLPKGGFLGFRLAHRCAIRQSEVGLDVTSDQLIKGLKGVDAMLYSVLHDTLKLECNVKVFSVLGVDPDETKWVLSDGFDVVDDEVYDPVSMRISGTRVVGLESHGIGATQRGDRSRYGAHGDIMPIVWVGKTRSDNGRQGAYATYGNEPSLDYIYQEICLIVKVHRD